MSACQGGIGEAIRKLDPVNAPQNGNSVRFRAPGDDHDRLRLQSDIVLFA